MPARPPSLAVTIGLLAVLGLFEPCPARAQAATDTTPAHMVSFFPLTQCPAGWSEASYAEGRLLLGYTDTTQYALAKQVGTPLQNETAPAGHSHTFQTSVSISHHGIAGTDGCCGAHGANQGGHDVPENPPGTTSSDDFNLPFTQLLACEKDPPQAGSSTTDDYPQYSIAFFNAAACPTNWGPAQGSSGSGQVDVNGYFVVPFYQSQSAIGTLVGNALANGQVLSHTHGYGASISLGDVEIEADSGSGTNLGGDGTYTFSGTTSAQDYAVPYVQLLLCEKAQFEQNTEPVGVPQKILTFMNASACPTGWVTSPTGSGRLLVGLPENGTPNQSFGANPLAKPGDLLTHTHAVPGTVDVGSQQVAEIGGCNFILCNKGTGSGGSYSFKTTSDPPSTTLPYFSVNLCQPNT
jgi:hypothetical protein